MKNQNQYNVNMDDKDTIRKYKDFLRSPEKDIKKLGYKDVITSELKNNIVEFLKIIKKDYVSKIKEKKVKLPVDINWENIIGSDENYDYKDYTDESYNRWISQLVKVDTIYEYKVWPSIESESYNPKNTYREVGYILKLEKLKIIYKILQAFIKNKNETENKYETLSGQKIIFLRDEINAYNNKRQLWLKAMQQIEDSPIEVMGRTLTQNDIEKFQEETNAYLLIEKTNPSGGLDILAIQRNDIYCGLYRPILCFVKYEENNQLILSKPSNVFIIKELRKDKRDLLINFLNDVDTGKRVSTVEEFINSFFDKMKEDITDNDNESMKHNRKVLSSLTKNKIIPLKIKIFNAFKIKK